MMNIYEKLQKVQEELKVPKTNYIEVARIF